MKNWKHSEPVPLGKYFLKRLFFPLLLLAGLLLGGCVVQNTPSPKTSSTADPQKVLRVGIDARTPPFVMPGTAPNEWVGFEVDLINAIAANNGYSVEFINSDVNQLPRFIGTCQLEAAISTLPVTNQQTILYSEPYYASGQVVVVKKGNIIITGPENLAGMMVGTQAGTVSETALKEIAGIQQKGYPSFIMAFQDLIDGNIDAVLSDEPRAWSYVNVKRNNLKVVGQPFGKVNFGIAVCRNKEGLLEQVNSNLAALKTNGTLDKLAQKWRINQNK